MVEKDTPTSIRPSEISIKSSEKGDYYFGNVITWTNKSSNVIINEIHDETDYLFDDIKERYSSYAQRIDQFFERGESFLTILDLPGLIQAITDVYGDPPNNNP